MSCILSSVKEGNGKVFYISVICDIEKKESASGLDVTCSFRDRRIAGSTPDEFDGFFVSVSSPGGYLDFWLGV